VTRREATFGSRDVVPWARAVSSGSSASAALLGLALLIVATGLAQARCVDEAKDLTERVNREQKLKPTAQTAAAAKELQKLDLKPKPGVDTKPRMDEVDCYNTLARARRAFSATSEPQPKPKPR
jgi:hypothetical protein